MKLSHIAFSILASCSASAEPIFLYNGTDLSNWELVTQKQDQAPAEKDLISAGDGLIHMYPSVQAGTRVPFGYIRTKETYSRYHLTLEYRWLNKKFAPRNEALRDAGVLYHLTGEDKVWPASMECQIQEGDTGDLVFLGTKAVSTLHPKPNTAPEGQGVPGLLAEEGGITLNGGPNGYVGRFAEFDTPTGWNTVEVIVQADEFAEHIVNGKTVARVSHIRKPDGTPLTEGTIGLQLEGAELQYRNIVLTPLSLPLQCNRQVVSLSAVDGQKSQTATITITNPGKVELACKPQLLGAHADAFKLGDFPETLAAGESADLTISFQRSTESFRHSAGIQIGPKTTGTFITLQGIGLKKFEGSNEPPLQDIVDALGIQLKVGGNDLHLDTKADKIGNSVTTSKFRGIEGAQIRITPLARFSPKGEAPFGYFKEGKKVQIATLMNSNEQAPDSHQCLFPMISGGKNTIELPAPKGDFSFYFEGHKQLSCTDNTVLTKATIKHTARVYPVSTYAGRPISDAYIIGFEEASNGDYQDALFLIENISPAN